MNPVDPNTQNVNDGMNQVSERDRVEEPSLADADADLASNEEHGTQDSLPNGSKPEGQVNAIRHRVAIGLENAAHKLRPQEGATRNFDGMRRTLASRIESAAMQIDQANLQDLTRSASEAARKYPLGVLAVGVGLGLVTGRMFRR